MTDSSHLQVPPSPESEPVFSYPNEKDSDPDSIITNFVFVPPSPLDLSVFELPNFDSDALFTSPAPPHTFSDNFYYSPYSPHSAEDDNQLQGFSNLYDASNPPPSLLMFTNDLSPNNRSTLSSFDHSSPSSNTSYPSLALPPRLPLEFYTPPDLLPRLSINFEKMSASSVLTPEDLEFFSPNVQSHIDENWSDFITNFDTVPPSPPQLDIN